MANERRLIDANKVIHDLAAMKDLFDAIEIDGMINGLKTAPTVDAVEVVHGRWVKRGNEKKCSICKFIYYSNNDDFNYCPNCGAKMDGDGNGRA